MRAPLSPLEPLRLLWRERFLIEQLTRRELSRRGRGSLLGASWLVLGPLLLLSVYVFVFGKVLGGSGRAGSGPLASYALQLFAGLLAFDAFAECARRAPSLLTGHAFYVKKAVFPLETLVWTLVVAAAVRAALGVVLLAAFAAGAGVALQWTAALAPLLLLPLLLTTAGLCWLLSCLGVYLRDLGHASGSALTVVMMLSCVFYPASALPENARLLFTLNPLAFAIESLRGAVLLGRSPDWTLWALHGLAGWALACAGLWFFRRASPGFADEL